MVKSLVILVIRVPWQSKQNGAAVDVSAEIVSYSYFYWKKYDCNWVTKLRSRYYCNMSRILPRLIRCHWSFDPRWVKISGHSEQLGPCGSTSHFVNNRHSKFKTRGASCIGGFGQTDGRRKFELGIPQSRGASYIRGATYIRDKDGTRFIRFTCWIPLKYGSTTTPPIIVHCQKTPMSSLVFHIAIPKTSNIRRTPSFDLLTDKFSKRVSIIRHALY